MAKESRFNCKIDGCPYPPHRYPSGAKAAYCKDHIRFRKGKYRGDIHVTGPMSVVLAHLQSAKDTGNKFAELPTGTDERTILALMHRDWICSAERVGALYFITDRGTQALKACEGEFNRRDGLCPMCGESPRHTSKSGRRNAYCLACDRIVYQQKRERGIRRINPDRGCSRCGKTPLYQYAGGSYSTYCAKCERRRMKLKSRKQRKKLIRIAQKGGPLPLCARCHSKPVKEFPNSLSHYCYECHRLNQRRWKWLRILAKREVNRPTETSLRNK